MDVEIGAAGSGFAFFAGDEVVAAVLAFCARCGRSAPAAGTEAFGSRLRSSVRADRAFLSLRGGGGRRRVTVVQGCTCTAGGGAGTTGGGGGGGAVGDGGDAGRERRAAEAEGACARDRDARRETK